MKAKAHNVRRRIAGPSAAPAPRLLQVVPASPGLHLSDRFFSGGHKTFFGESHLVPSSARIDEKDGNFCMCGFHSKMKRRVACSLWSETGLAESF